MVSNGVIADVAWFDDEAEGSRHSYACAAVDRLRAEQSHREESGRLAWELYTRKPIPAGGTGTYDRVRGPINGVRRAIKTLGAEMGQHKPRPMFLTSGADLDLQDRGKKAGRFCDGMYYAVKFDESIAPLCRLDMMLFGDGFTQWQVGPRSLECERVFALEVVVDEGDIGSDGEPMTFFRERFVDKRLLARDFPKHADDIMSAAGASGLSRWWQANSESLVRVVQAWRRGYDDGEGDGPKGGRWITCIDNLTLDEGEWPYEWCPIVRLFSSAPVRGYYAESIVDLVLENQRELDFLSDIIRRTLRRSLPKIGVPEESNVTDDQITNEEFAIIRFANGHAPVPLTLVGISPQLLQERDYQLRALYDELGLSEMAVSSQMPAGLSMSGRSQLVYEDVKSKRQLEMLDAHEAWYIENARTMLRMIKHAAKGDRSYEVVYRGRDHIERIKFADIDVDEDQYVMKAMPTSKLPSTPSAKYAVLDSWLERGLISVAAYRSMSEMPDLEKENAIENAAREHAQWVVTEILIKGADFEPHNIMKMDVQLEVGGLMFLDAEKRGANEANLGKLRLFLTECRNLWLDQQGIPRPGGPAPTPGGSALGAVPTEPSPGGPAPGGGPPVDPLAGPEGAPPGAEPIPLDPQALEAAAA
jgi:hypothetical protein